MDVLRKLFRKLQGFNDYSLLRDYKKVLLNVVFIAAGSHHRWSFGEATGMLVRVGLLG